MKHYDIIDSIINELINSGSNISYLKELRRKSVDEIRKDKSLEDILFDISKDIEYSSYMFLNKKNNFNTNVISGFSTSIFLGDNNSNLKYILLGGTKSRNSNTKIDFNTVFDIASITKLYTLILAFKLEELGLINLDDRVVDINPEFNMLGDFTLNDLIKLYGEMQTDGNINSASSYNEAYEIFKTIHLVSDSRNSIKYNDFGSMIISNTIEKVISEKLGKKITFDEIMNTYLIKELDLNHTMFNPKSDNVSGNGYSFNYPHDPKAKIFNGVCGHAGLFTNSMDLMKVADSLFNNSYLDDSHKKRLYECNINGSVKGNMGLYLKHPLGYEMTYNPSELSSSSFTSQGWTGSIASFELRNKIHNSILVNAIIDDNDNKLLNNKPLLFSESFDKYQMQIVKIMMLMYVIKKYYEKYYHIKESIEMKRVLSL